MLVYQRVVLQVIILAIFDFGHPHMANPWQIWWDRSNSSPPAACKAFFCWVTLDVNALAIVVYIRLYMCWVCFSLLNSCPVIIVHTFGGWPVGPFTKAFCCPLILRTVSARIPRIRGLIIKCWGWTRHCSFCFPGLSSITIDHAYPIGPQISHLCLPGLVFTYKKLMGKSPCYQWENPLFLWSFSSSQTVSLRESSQQVASVSVPTSGCVYQKSPFQRPLYGSVSEGSKDGKTQELETHFLCLFKAGL